MSAVARERLFTPASFARLREIADVDPDTILSEFASPGRARCSA